MGDVELDPATRMVRLEGKPVDLTSVEFNLLEVLLREAGTRGAAGAAGECRAQPKVFAV